MKTTLEIPDPLFREAKSIAGKSGITFKRLMTDALESRIAQIKEASEKERLRKHFGVVSPTPSDRKRVRKTIEDEFGQIDQEAWKSS